MEGRGKCTYKDSLELENPNRRRNRKETEDYLLQTVIKNGEFGKIEKEITPMALKCCESNALLMGMKVNFELRSKADSKGPDEERFNRLTTSVEKYTNCLLDPLRAHESKREEFGDALDAILDEAIQLEQKQFFAHPVVDAEMKRKWHGRDFITSGWNRWRPLFSMFCVFDLVFSPILYALFSLIRIRREKKQNASQVTPIYLMYMETPYFKFVRDTVSYIVLLVLHYALCLSPSSVAFSGLEVTILIFFIGRFLVEVQQIFGVMQFLKRHRGNGTQSHITLARKTLSIYQRDLWNRLDIISLLLYLMILMLRTASFITSGSVENNRVLAIAGYFYSFNTLVLTFRVFGHVMEQSRHVGTTQIALFSILKDLFTIFWQFPAAVFAFSIAITKVYMAEKSFVGNGHDRNDILCKTSGISCWWMMIKQMFWSLLDKSEGLDAMKSVDLPSETLARILYAGFLIMGVILLINMLIALLSNTYQQIQENSLKEWSFKRAVTIQTYDGYDPIPVPFNIIYSVFKLIKLVKGKDENKGMGMLLDTVVFELDREYSAKYGNHFPVTGEAKEDLVVRETGRNRQMVSQILSSTFKSQGRGIKCFGPEEAWKVDTGIEEEGPLLTCAESTEEWPRATYCKALSVECPCFEVVILETGKQMSLGVGIVTLSLNESSGASEAPGYGDGFVGYFTDGFILEDVDGDSLSRETKGPVIALRGDRIRCTVLFEKRKGRGEKVPVLFTLNGREILIHSHDREDPEIFVDSGKRPYPCIVMNDGCSVLAKMYSRDNENYEASNIADLRKQVEEMKTSLEESNRNLQTLLARMPDLSTKDYEQA